MAAKKIKNFKEILMDSVTKYDNNVIKFIKDTSTAVNKNIEECEEKAKVDLEIFRKDIVNNFFVKDKVLVQFNEIEEQIEGAESSEELKSLSERLKKTLSSCEENELKIKLELIKSKCDSKADERNFYEKYTKLNSLIEKAQKETKPPDMKMRDFLENLKMDQKDLEALQLSLRKILCTELKGIF